MFEKLVTELLAKMVSLIEENQLELLQRYPNDLHVADKWVLERIAVPNSEFAWMVGHSHTHLVPLGLHKNEQDLVTGLTNMGNDDKFYHVKIGQAGKFTFKEVDRNAFAALGNTPVHFENKGGASDFWLFRLKQRVGHVNLKMVGDMRDRKVEVTISPMSGITPNERAALPSWAKEAVIQLAGTWFIKTEVTWGEPIPVDHPLAA